MIDQLVEAYRTAKSRLLIFDYDGVLAPIMDRPEQAALSDEVLTFLRTLSNYAGNKVIVVSGRDHESLDGWLGNLPIDMSAEHGHFRKEFGEWHTTTTTDMSWTGGVETIMAQLVREYPGSHIEKKQASRVWHYRQAKNPVDKRDARRRIEQVAQGRAEVMPGKCVIDVRAPGVDKGDAVQHWYKSREWGFVLCIGDDVTDEAMFMALPQTAGTVKVGQGDTAAKYRFRDQLVVIDLLQQLSSYSQSV